MIFNNMIFGEFIKKFLLKNLVQFNAKPIPTKIEGKDKMKYF